MQTYSCQVYTLPSGNCGGHHGCCNCADRLLVKWVPFLACGILRLVPLEIEDVAELLGRLDDLEGKLC